MIQPIGKRKLTDRAKLLIRGAYPMMVNHIKRKGHIADMRELERIFGADTLELALFDKIFTKTSVVKRSKSNLHPDIKIDVAKLSDFDPNMRPDWLDEE